MSQDILASPDLETQSSFSIDWEDYFRIFVANLWLILAITGLFTVIGVITYVRKPNLYTSTVQVVVEKTETNMRSSQEVMMMPSFKGEDDYYGTQIAILTSRRISDMVNKELNPPGWFTLNARRLPKTRILALSVTHPDPQWAAKIANKYAEIFVEESEQDQSYFGKQMLKLIPSEELSESGAGKVAPSASTVEGEAAPASEPDENPSTVEEVKKVIPWMENSKGEIDELSGFNKKEFAESLFAVTADLEIQRLRNEKLQVESSLLETSQRYRPNHPIAKSLQDRLTFINDRLKERTRRILGNVRVSLTGKNRIRNVKIIEDAVPPDKPSAPDRKRGIIQYSFVGFFVSIALVFFLERANQKIRSERDFHNVPLPFLGHIPLVSELSSKKKKEVELKRSSIFLPEALTKNAVLADSVASVRTHILFSMPYERSKRIMLTSCIPDEGKTTVSIFLSLSLSGLGRKILYIDADMRRPFAHNYLGLKNETGLSDYLTGNASLEEVLRSATGCTLKVVTAGSKSANPAELLASERFREILEYGSANYDRVVIDVPPVLFIPDGLIVAKHIHTGVLVCGSGMVHKKTVRSVKQKFDSIGHSFIGIVVNKVDIEKGLHGYRYYRNYKNYYAIPKTPKVQTPT